MSSSNIVNKVILQLELEICCNGYGECDNCKHPVHSTASSTRELDYQERINCWDKKER